MASRVLLILTRRDALSISTAGFAELKLKPVSTSSEIACAKGLLSKLGIPDDIYRVECNDPGYWLWICERLISSDFYKKMLCALWFLWFNRNLVIHGSPALGIDTLYDKLVFFLYQYDARPSLCPQRNLASTEPEDYIIISCDGSWSEEWQNGGWGYVAENEDFIISAGAGRSRNIHSSHHAEGTALLESFMAAAHQNWDKVIFKMDSTIVFRAVMLGQWRELPSTNWLHTCWNLLDLHPGWKVFLVPKEKVFLADRLARKARSEGWCWENMNAIPRLLSSSV